ncbi:MAG: NAD(P)/FAD-dependent oxidoreductase [Oscillospiraceae bacterium]|nr:NAD(P)/FAD-dependent oxidoreductase [Oscillospiraceae bacterium]
MYDVIVVGGGAAGLMAAGTAASLGKNTLLIEKMPRTARKILVTGKGRCNVTNNCDVETVLKNVVSNPKFLYSALGNFSPVDTMSFFEGLGVPLKTERGNRVFPESDRAMDVADALRRYCDTYGVKVLTDTVKNLIISDCEIKGVKTEAGKEYFGSSVIVATGGLSYSKTGSTGDGYRLAKTAGHNIVAPRASLIGLKIAGSECKEMQGLSLKNTKLSLYSKANNKCVYSEMGEMLFTHFGISGPIALSASAHLKENPQNYYIELDLKPALSLEMLDARLSRDFSENLNRDFVNSLGKLLPKALIDVVVERSKIPAHQKVNQITKEQRQGLCRVLKSMRFDVCGREDIESAIITAGGVETREINPKTMQSKLVKGLYFAGEVIDVDALTGGFNLQIAFSTGYTAALNA